MAHIGSNTLPRVDFHTPAEHVVRDKPSPLRIVKRSRPIAHVKDSPKESPFSRDSPVNTPEESDRKFPLKIAKRRGRHKAAAILSDQSGSDGLEQNTGYRPSFWASSVELGRPRGRVWEETLTRCRGLLTSSTPFLKDSRQSRILGRSRSHRRAPSCRTASSDSSILEYHGFPLPNRPPSSRQSFGSRVVERPAPPLPQTTPRLDFSRAAHPFVLSPHISVVSQCSGRDAGRQSVWAAVEVTGRLSRIPSSRSPSGSSAPAGARGSFVDHELDCYFEFGCLYDLSVDVLPTPDSAIVQVIQEQDFPTTIQAGSSVILLVHVLMDSAQGTRRTGTGHVRQKSDELMEDLELELGTSAVGFMHIRVSYSHSAFPESTTADPDAAGVSGLRSRMETTATASLTKQFDAASLWSPRPEPLQSHIVPLVQRHWGLDKAMEIRRLILGPEHPRRRREASEGRGGKAGLESPSSASGRTPTRAAARRGSLFSDCAPKASTLGPAVGRRARQLLCPVPPSAPLSLRSSRSSEDDRCHHGFVDSLQNRNEGHGNAEARQDEGTLYDKPTKDAGFWNWGLWF